MSSPVNVKKLAIWKCEDESYGEVMSMEKRLMTYTDTPTVSTATLYGDGEIADSVTRNSGGTLALNVHDLLSAERAVMYGEKVEKGANVTRTTDVGKYVAVALMSDNVDGTVNLRKWFKVKFAQHAESVQQISDGSETFSTITLNGTYIATDDGTLRAMRDDLDPVTDAEIINKWLTEAEYIGPEG